LFSRRSERTLAKRKWTREQWAAWAAKRDAVIAAGADDRKRLAESIENYERRMEEERRRHERRRRLINRFTLGLVNIS
jgi:hypothetical protein